jgi:hypothetical protein
MAPVPLCDICDALPPSRAVPVHCAAAVATWRLCVRCWLALQAGWKALFPDARLQELLDPDGQAHLTDLHVRLFRDEGERLLRRA